jgi:ATP-independent RNA helicase DbpA
VIDQLSRETLCLDTIETIVLDEADKMLNMGFYGDVVKIVKAARRVQQRVLFSATFSQDVERYSGYGIFTST